MGLQFHQKHNMIILYGRKITTVTIRQNHFFARSCQQTTVCTG